MTVNKKRVKYNKFKLAYAFIIVITIIVLLSFTYADEIKDTFNSLFVNHKVYKSEDGSEHNAYDVTSDGRKEINQNVDLVAGKCGIKHPSGKRGPKKDDKCWDMYTPTEIESMLNVKLIKTDLFKKDKFILEDLRKENDKYTFLKFRVYDAFRDFLVPSNNEGGYTYASTYEGMKDKPNVIFSINIKTNYWNQPDGFSDIYFGVDANIESYYIKNLNTTGIKKKLDDGYVYLTFDYDDINYSISVDSRYPNKDADETLDKIVASLYF